MAILMCQPEHYGVDPVSDIQVFAAVYRGELGIESAVPKDTPRAAAELSRPRP